MIFDCRRCFWLLLLLTAISQVVAAGRPLEVVRIDPAGKDVPAARQIVIQFNRPVVPLGHMARKREEIPVSISPALDCQWRWLDRQTLACQLDDQAALQPASKYSLVVWPGIKAQDGGTIAEPYVHEFITARPKIRHARFSSWKSPGFPVLQVIFNQPVSQSSVQRHVYFQVAEKGALQRIPGAANPRPDDDQLLRQGGQDFRRVWLLEPQRELPQDSPVKLQVEPGLKAIEGKLGGSGDRTVLAFDTFPEFCFLGIACRSNRGKALLITQRNVKKAGRCNPRQEVALTFSAPVLTSEISKKLHIQPDLAGGRRNYDP